MIVVKSVKYPQSFVRQIGAIRTWKKIDVDIVARLMSPDPFGPGDIPWRVLHQPVRGMLSVHDVSWTSLWVIQLKTPDVDITQIALAAVDEVLQWKDKCTAVLISNKCCGTQIYFDPSSGKMISMEIATHKNHMYTKLTFVPGYTANVHTRNTKHLAAVRNTSIKSLHIC